MSLEKQIEQALDFFSREGHPHSFVLEPNDGAVLFSAPHAVLQTRNAKIKYAERFTGMLCLLLSKLYLFPVMYKTRHLQDDANHDVSSPYRDALCAYVREHNIKYVFDLHQLSPDRPIDLCICTGRGQNLSGDNNVVSMVRECFAKHGIQNITIDDPFDAASPHTVSATVARHCRVPAIQLELNTRLLMAEYPEYCFDSVLHALADLACLG